MRPCLAVALLAFTAASAASAQPQRLFVSPAGEPFRGEDGLRDWFTHADANGDGTLGWVEFEADFTRYFAVLDADRDGEIAPAEVEAYETRILPEMANRGGMGRPRSGYDDGGGHAEMSSGRGSGFGGGGRPGGPSPGAMAMMAGAARYGLIPISHPIMNADEDFNRGVTRGEWAHAAAQRFAMLDAAHNGRLTLDGLIARRMQGRGPERRGRGRAGGGDGPPPPPPGD
jgi:hypothetical protein